MTRAKAAPEPTGQSVIPLAAARAKLPELRAVPDVPLPVFWPNGSLVLMGPDTEFPGRELGHVVREGGRYRAWCSTEDGHRDKGIHESFLAAMSALPKPSIKPDVAAAAAAKGPARSKPAARSARR
jgi:hypothetical protein